MRSLNTVQPNGEKKSQMVTGKRSVQQQQQQRLNGIARLIGRAIGVMTATGADCNGHAMEKPDVAGLLIVFELKVSIGSSSARY